MIFLSICYLVFCLYRCWLFFFVLPFSCFMLCVLYMLTNNGSLFSKIVIYFAEALFWSSPLSSLVWCGIQINWIKYAVIQWKTAHCRFENNCWKILIYIQIWNRKRKWGKNKVMRKREKKHKHSGSNQHWIRNWSITLMWPGICLDIIST